MEPISQQAAIEEARRYLRETPPDDPPKRDESGKPEADAIAEARAYLDANPSQENLSGFEHATNEFLRGTFGLVRGAAEIVDNVLGIDRAGEFADDMKRRTDALPVDPERERAAEIKDLLREQGKRNVSQYEGADFLPPGLERHRRTGDNPGEPTLTDYEPGQIEQFVGLAQKDPGAALAEARGLAVESAPTMVPTLAAGGAGAALKLGSLGRALLAYGAAAPIEVGAQLSEAVDARRDPESGERQELSTRDKALAVSSGALAAAPEALAIDRLFGRLSAAMDAAGVDDASRATIQREIADRLGLYLTDVAKQGGTEGGTEIAQGIIADVAAKHGWDPEREIGGDALQEFLAGAVLGSSAQATVSAPTLAKRGAPETGKKEPPGITGARGLSLGDGLPTPSTGDSGEATSPIADTKSEDGGFGASQAEQAQSASRASGGADESPTEDTAGLHEAEIDRVRSSFDLDALPQAKRRAWERALSEARAARDSGDLDPDVLAETVAKKPRVLTDTEHAALVQRAAEVQNRHEAVEREIEAEIDGGADPEALAPLRAEAVALVDRLDQVTRAADLSGTEAARALSVRRMRLDRETYTLAGVLRRGKVAKGQALDTKEEAKLRSLVQNLDQAQARVRELESQTEQKARAEVRVLAERAVSRAAKRKGKKAKLRAEREALKDELRSLGLRVNTVEGVAADSAALLGKLALNYASEAGLTLEQAVARVVSDVPDVDALDVEAAIAQITEQQAGALPPKVRRELSRARDEASLKKKAVQEGVRKLAPKSVLSLVAEVATAPRALIASADLSSAVRQGGLLSARRGGTAVKALGRSAKAAFSPAEAEAAERAIMEHPNQAKRAAAGLYLAPANGGGLNAQEEAFASRLTDALAWVSASERQMSTHLNAVRVAAFDGFLEKYPDATPDELRAWASYVNAASGRGDLKAFEGAARELSLLFFSPRFLASRFQAFGALLTNFSRPRVLAEVAKDWGAYASVATAALALAHLAGASVSLDPREPDFLKIRVGETRFDILGGFQQVMRVVLRTGLAVTDAAGVTSGYSDPADIPKLWGWFLRFKLSPAINIPTELVEGETVVGEPRDPWETIVRGVIPLWMQAAYDAAREEDAATGAAVGAADFVGVGSSTYRR